MENLNDHHPPSQQKQEPPPTSSSSSQPTTLVKRPQLHSPMDTETLENTLLNTIDRVTALDIDSAPSQCKSAMAYLEFAELFKENHSAEKQRALTKGIEAARRSIELSPNDLQYRLVLISLLFKAVRDGKDRREVIQECQDALKLNVSTDQQDLKSQITTLFRVCNQERHNRIDSMWNSWDYLQQSHLKVAKCELEAHFHSLQDDLAVKFIREAWDFGQFFSDWEFWPCCCCGFKCGSSGLLFQHFADAHCKDLSPFVLTKMCNGTLKQATAPSPIKTEDPPDKDKIVINGNYLCLLLAPSRSEKASHSSTHYPSLDLGFRYRRYQREIKHWHNDKERREWQGTELHQALIKMSEMQSHDKARSVVTTTGQQALPDNITGLAVLLTQQEVQAPTQTKTDVKDAIMRLSADIDSEIKKKGSWNMGTAHKTKELRLSINPFGAYDYRDVLSPLLKTYFEAFLEDLADKVDAEGSNTVWKPQKNESQTSWDASV